MSLENKIPIDDLDAAGAIFNQMYETFNSRDVESTLLWMHKDVEWANGMEGKVEYGKDAVREYWTRQWTLINPKVDPVDINLESDGRINVTVHQVVHELSGELLADLMVHHLYTIEDGLIKRMEIQQL